MEPVFQVEMLKVLLNSSMSFVSCQRSFLPSCSSTCSELQPKSVPNSIDLSAAASSMLNFVLRFALSSEALRSTYGSSPTQEMIHSLAMHKQMHIDVLLPQVSMPFNWAQLPARSASCYASTVAMHTDRSYAAVPFLATAAQKAVHRIGEVHQLVRAPFRVCRP